MTKVKVRPVLLKGSLFFQATEYCGEKVLHHNYEQEEMIQKIADYLNGLFRQVELQGELTQINILISKKGKLTIKQKKKLVASPKEKISSEHITHNREKKYILPEGTKVPFMIDLGVMTLDGKIVRSAYDKYKQINRFLEFIEDVLPELPKERELRILDFGCGKSYLTFAMYYFLHELRGYQVRVTGLDLKEDVIKSCNELKCRYGYNDIEFLQGDIAAYEDADAVDLVVSLHACDTATDYALWKAVQWGAKVILCVPCCQHELNRQIKNENMQNVLKYGLIKERMAALFTDAMRANLLEIYGYRTQIMEFIDLEHTPKNILIRAVKLNKFKPDNKEGLIQKKRLGEYIELQRFLHAETTLFHLLQTNIQSGERNTDN